VQHTTGSYYLNADTMAVIHLIISRVFGHSPQARRLDRLDAATRPEEMNIPGFGFHPLRGFKPTRYSVHVNGPWCITFEFEDGDACRIDFEQ
jgi:proteic killer suppression protein